MREDVPARSNTPPAPAPHLHVTVGETHAARPLLSFETDSLASSDTAASGVANAQRRTTSLERIRSRLLPHGSMSSGDAGGASQSAFASGNEAIAQLSDRPLTDALVPPPLAAAAGRVYHSLFRERPPRSGAQTPELAEPLNPGHLEIRSRIGSDAGSERSGLLPRSRMSRPASHRALTDMEHQATRDSWEQLRNWFVLWLCAALVTLVVSWWWFPLGVAVGGLGILGSVSALRHKSGVELVQPAKGVQYLGVLTGLLAACAAAACFVALASVRCAKAEDCSRLRLMLVIVAVWFAGMAVLSGHTARAAYGLIQRLEPTFYWRQSEAVDVAPDEHNLGVVVQQEVVTPSTIRAASARLGSLHFEDV